MSNSGLTDHFTKEFRFDSDWCAETLQLTADHMTLQKNGLQHGIVFCSVPLDIFNSYVEFKIEI